MTTPDFEMKIYVLQAEMAKTLANPTRLALLNCLKDGEKNVSELFHAIRSTQSNVSQHLERMREKRIVKTRQAGRTFYYSLASPKIAQACDLINELLMEQVSQKQELAKTHSPRR